MLQLELDFQEQIEEAKLHPEGCSLEMFYSSLELIAVLDLPPPRRLEIAGNAITQVSEVFDLKFQALKKFCKSKGNAEGPILDEDDGLTRRYMNCDDDLTLVPEPRTHRRSPETEKFFVELEDTDTLLNELGVEQSQPEPKLEVILEVIEEESVAIWIDKIGQLLGTRKQQISFAELYEQLELSVGQLWLGLLLGNYALRMVGDSFYSGEIRVSHSP